MNQSKKILAALVAIPASVIVAGEVQAAEETTIETKTATFDIKNDLVNSNAAIETGITLTAEEQKVAKEIFTLMNTYASKSTTSYELDLSGKSSNETNLEYAGKLVKKVFDYLKANLNTSVTVAGTTFDNTTELYGVFSNITVKATEKVTTTTTAAVAPSTTPSVTTVSKVNLDVTSLKYYGDQQMLNQAKEHTIPVDSVATPIQKVKAVYDFVMQSTHIKPTNHQLNLVTNGGSSHAYALWTYILLKKVDPNIKVKYVYGIIDGEFQSWNIVQIGDKWYHLDPYSGDTTTDPSEAINYRHFLTYTEFERRIIGPEAQEIITDSTYNYFKTADNLAQSDEALYYANSESHGEIHKLDFVDLTSTKLDTNTLKLSQASTGPGRMVYYEQTSIDTATAVGKYLYFINDSQGKYLYRYDLNKKELLLLVKEQLQSITLKGSSLNYKTTDGYTDFLPLNRIIDLDQELANEVIKAINAIAVLDKTKPEFKTAVLNARQLYMALTDEQKQVVKNINYSILEGYENELSKGNTKVEDITNKINALDEMQMDYVEKVEDAESAYSSNKALQSSVYNYDILKKALEKVNAAKKLNDELGSKVKEVPAEKDAFDVVADFIPFIENLLKQYDSYLPSIQKIFKNKTALEEYRKTAERLRVNTQSFINEVKVIDDNSLTFLTDMERLNDRYEKFNNSQKYLISNKNNAAVTDRLNKYQTMLEEIEKLNTLLLPLKAVVTTEEAAKITLTPELKVAMKEAQALYNKMKTSQKEAVKDNYSKLTLMINRIEALENNSDIKEIEKLISALNINTVKGLGDLSSQVSTIDTAILSLGESGNFKDKKEVESLIKPELFAKFTNLKLDANKAITFQDDVKRLGENPEKEEVDKLKKHYVEELNKELYKFLEDELKTLEGLLTKFDNASLEEQAKVVSTTIDEVLKGRDLKKAKEALDAYNALKDGGKAFVDKSKVDDLNKLIAELEKDAAAVQKAIDDVIAMIDKLNNKSNLADIDAAQAAYDNLSPEQQTLVKNFDEIEKIKKQIEAAVVDAEAIKVINLILNLTDESSPTEITAARDAYTEIEEELSRLSKEVAERLAKAVTLLETFEKQMQSQLEAATKEAQPVIDRINKIDLNKYTEAQITSIYNAYGALSLLAKDVVIKLGAYEKLMNALDHVKYQNTIVKQAKLEAAAFDEHMNKLDRNSSTAEIAAARALYNRLSYEAKRNVQTYDKLVRLETMWKDPTYIELVHTYYPDYIHAIKPGGIEITKPNYDSLYIPDDLGSDSVANYLPTEATWSSYEEMTYRSGRYMANITSSQVKNLSDRTLTLKADDMEIILPVVDLKDTSGTVGVSVSVSNNRLNIAFTENGNAKTFSEYVEVRVPISAFKGQRYQMIERIVSNSGTAASFKVDGADFVIRTKTSGTFQGATSNVNYNDLGTSSAGNAVREFAKRGITYNTTGRSVQMTKQATRADVATLIAKALDLSSSAKTKYQDLSSAISASRAQALQEAGIMSGVTSSRFGINTTVTKQEAAIIIANMYRYLNQDLSQAYNALKTNYTDVSNLTFEARQSIAILELFGVVDGNGKFDPNEHLTRGQFAELLYKSLTVIDFL